MAFKAKMVFNTGMIAMARIENIIEIYCTRFSNLVFVSSASGTILVPNLFASIAHTNIPDTM